MTILNWLLKKTNRKAINKNWSCKKKIKRKNYIKKIGYNRKVKWKVIDKILIKIKQSNNKWNNIQKNEMKWNSIRKVIKIAKGQTERKLQKFTT